MFCWMDEWIEMTMDDIRALEAETKDKLDKVRNKKASSGCVEK